MPAQLWKKLVFFLCFTLIALPQLCVAESNANDSLAQFLSLADIHFDAFTYCHERPCALIEKLRKAPASAWPAIFSSYQVPPSTYGQDTNYPLLTAALSAAKEVAIKKNAKFVIVLGDFIGHDYHYNYRFYSKDKKGIGYQAFIKKTLEFLNNELARAFPTTDVYAVVGNNDSYIDDYVLHPHGRFFKETGALWSTLVKDKHNRALLQKEFAVGGYYAVTIPEQPNLRLIVLNTVLFSSKSRGEGVAAGAKAQLDWLHDELQAAQVEHQKVYIAMHIPVGIDVYASLRVRLFTIIDFWDSQYAQRFKVELQQFAPQIAGIFAGHVHADWFQIMKMSNSNEIPVSGTPSISPIFGNNPGFKIYSYAPKTLIIEDFLTYFNPLETNRGWGKEYDFAGLYQSNCLGCPITKGIENVKPTGILAEHYKRFYAVSTNSQPITTKWNPYYWCSIHEVTSEDYKNCLE